MGLVSAIWLILLGVLGASSLIIAKKPDARQIIAKLAPYQGWIGAVSALWGVWGLVRAVLNLGILGSAPLAWITMVAVALVQTCLGLILGIGVLKTFIKHPEAQRRMDETLTQLAPQQGAFGLAAIGWGVWSLISSFL
ncbi:MAG: hypothetical protein H6744_09585 [Deltaproteobacteria bacterium]|nr:hypothetical protein [Deltaproteobacteria bacterium]